jgi:hypothetical protein
MMDATSEGFVVIRKTIPSIQAVKPSTAPLSNGS